MTEDEFWGRPLRRDRPAVPHAAYARALRQTSPEGWRVIRDTLVEMARANAERQEGYTALLLYADACERLATIMEMH